MNNFFVKITGILSVLFCTLIGNAQTDFPALDTYFKKYEVIQIETPQILATIQASTAEKYPIRIQNWSLMLTKSGIIADDYFCVNEKNVRFNHVKDGKIVPMNGYTEQGGRVSLTFGHDFVQGFIKDGDDTYYIEPVRHFVKGDRSGLFVLYNDRDIIPGKEHKCGVEESKHRIDNNRFIENRGVTNNDCIEVEYAIATDWLMYVHYGSVADVEAHNIAVVNNMQTNYDDEFNDEIRFAIVEQYIVSTSGGDPWTGSTNAGNLLDSFTAWAPTGFTATHDLGTLWTHRDLDGSTIGLAWVGTVCTAYRYNILEDFSSNAQLKRVLAAHEIGHNFNAGHDTLSGYIMSQSVSNTNVWSAKSQDSINIYYQGRTCLGTCTPINPVVNFVSTAYQVAESGDITDTQYCGVPYKTIMIPVSLNRSIQSATTIGVSITNGGNAVQSRDFELVTTTLTFPSGFASTQYIEVVIINDAIEESDETFILELTWISGPAQVGSDNICTVTITDGLDKVSNDCCSPGNFVTYGNYNYSAPYIFLSFYEDGRSRFLYLPAQLTNSGLTAGYLSGLSMYIQSKNSSQPFNNFRVGMKNVNDTTLDGVTWYDTEQVYLGTISTVAGAWLKIDFEQPFYWDGTSSIYFEFCFDNSSYSGYDYIRASNPVGGGTGRYVNAYVNDGKNGCELGSGDITLNYSNNSIQPQFRFYPLKGVSVENTLNKTAKTSIVAGETAHLYSNDQKIIASIKNLGTTDIGCMEAKVATTGTGKKALPFGGGNYADKTIQISGDEDALYEVSLYFSAAQMTTWSAEAGRLNVLKSNVPLSGATLSDVEIVRPDTIFNALGQDNAYVYKGVFSGFSWLTLTDYHAFSDVLVANTDLLFEAVNTGLVLKNNSNETYKIHVNNSGQLQATSTSPTEYKTLATANGIFVTDIGKGIILKSPGGSNYRLTVSNTGQLNVNSISTLPSTFVKQQTGNIAIEHPAGSAILKSANGTCWRVFVNENGQIRTVEVKCP